MSEEELLDFAIEFRRGLLGGRPSRWRCRMVCLPLQGLLAFQGYEVRLAEGVIIDGEGDEIDHTWLELPDGRILDPTADQFTQPNGKPMPEVYLGARPEWYEVAA